MEKVTQESNWTEARLQSECFIWHWNHYENERGLLFTVDNNANDIVKGSVRKAMGRVAGVSDMVYFFNGKMYCFELKLPSKKQSHKQKAWQIRLMENGAEYVVIEYLDTFKKCIEEIHVYGQILPF